MAFFALYFDDSGTHTESKVAVAAAYIAAESQWGNFKVDWERARREESFEAFHRADFESGQGEFENWSSSKKERVIGRLVRIIETHTLAGRATALIKSDYDETISGRLREKLGGYHYTFAVKDCFSFIQKWRRDCGITEPMQMIFDRTGKGRGEIERFFDEAIEWGENETFGIVKDGYSFRDKKESTPIQAADILAWEAYKTISGPLALNKTFVLNGPSVKARILYKKNLAELAAEMNRYYDKVGWDLKPPKGKRG